MRAGGALILSYRPSRTSNGVKDEALSTLSSTEILGSRSEFWHTLPFLDPAIGILIAKSAMQHTSDC